MENLSLHEIKQYAGTYTLVPLCRTLYADLRTPLEVLRLVQTLTKHCYLLESMEDTDRWGRYTFIGYDPALGLSCKNGVVRFTGEREETIRTDTPQDLIRQVVEANRAPRLAGLPPFVGGLVGYFAYDFIQYAEPSLQLRAEDDAGFNDFDLMLFHKVIVFDHLKQKLFLIVNVRTGQADTAYEKALAELDRMEALLHEGQPTRPEPLQLDGDFEALFSKSDYCRMVEKGKTHIVEGDIFQVVLSNRMSVKATGSLLDTYRVLRTLNPSPYMFYFSGDDIEMAGASPETLTRLEDGSLFTFPLAGSRPRGKTRAEDQALEADLLHNTKELAEHNMLVDLGRNDLGRISRIGSVHVEEYLNVLRFSHIMHLGSTVRGQIREDKSAVDAILSVLPAGTLSGAPKIRACQIIDELEGHKRGIYGGAIGYIDFTGNMDCCIGIRLAYKKKDRLYVCSGAGIVADSIPEQEYQECINKAKAVILAIRQAEGGIDA